MKIIILYNPNSTGNSKQNALKLEKKLRKRGDTTLDVEVMETTHAGHAEEIATEHAKSGKEILLISSSGDGGYHELINGALSHKNSKVITGLLPSGNANDHHTALNDGSLVERIVTKSFSSIDTIAVTGAVKGKPWKRYAHSYVGLGLSATAARDITEQRPNIITEKLLVVKSFLLLKPVTIIVGKTTHRYGSMIFSNIDTMSKMIKLSTTSTVHDGKMELNTIGFVSKIRLAQYFVQATTKGLKDHATITSYSFTTTSQLAIQLDGETVQLDKGSKVTLECIHENLRCVV